jgi:hypothetical protein
MNENDAFKTFMTDHELIAKLMSYPPFATSASLRDDVAEKLASIGPVGNPPVPERLVSYHDPIKETFSEELEEASLWMDRYPLDNHEAIRASMEMDGIDDRTIDIHLSTM